LISKPPVNSREPGIDEASLRRSQKYKITSTVDLEKYLFPFLDCYQLQAKKAKSYKVFREIVLMMRSKKHLTNTGFNKIVKLRDKIRALGKKHNSLNDGNR